MDKQDPESLIVTRNGSPLLVGFSEDGIFVSSEQIGFAKYTREFIRLKDREILKLQFKKDMRESIKERILFMDQVQIKMNPTEGFRCFFEEEIFE